MAGTLPAKPIDLAELGARAADFARTSRSAATERSYRSDWADFIMHRLGVSPATLYLYIPAARTANRPDV